MDILKAEFDDIPEIIAIQKLAFYNVAKFYNNFKLGPLQTTISDLESSFDSYIYFKAIEENTIIGSIRANIFGELCKIENLIVHPEFQGKGLGKKLISYLENEFAEFSAFELFTGKETSRNINLYKSLGYKITGEIPPTKTEPVLVTMNKTKDI